MGITQIGLIGFEPEQFEACKRTGFIELEWSEGLNDVTGTYAHWAVLLGKKILIRAIVEHVIINPESGRKKYYTRLVLIHQGPTGDFLYASDKRLEMDLEKALAFAQWQATVAFRVIEGDDARPVGPDEEGMKIRC